MVEKIIVSGFADEIDPQLDVQLKVVKELGMEYICFTTKHHDGFDLWDSAYTDYDIGSATNKTDVIKEFTDACRKYDLKIGLYSSLMDWHHPDGWKCAFDLEARRRFLDYIEELKETSARWLENGNIEFDGHVYIRHDSEVTIDCSRLSKIFISVYDNAKIHVMQRDGASVYVYLHGENCSVESDGEVMIRRSK